MDITLFHTKQINFSAFSTSETVPTEVAIRFDVFELFARVGSMVPSSIINGDDTKANVNTFFGQPETPHRSQRLRLYPSQHLDNDNLCVIKQAAC